mmetsp:Transcript_12078/g.38704  ORF Transcript_12078/g.38704 Transcript_12078/m.38704 type:complete len:223 (-) Transcript_12078:438-1106(-)
MSSAATPGGWPGVATSSPPSAAPPATSRNSSSSAARRRPETSSSVLEGSRSSARSVWVSSKDRCSACSGGVSASEAMGSSAPPTPRTMSRRLADAYVSTTRGRGRWSAGVERAVGACAPRSSCERKAWAQAWEVNLVTYCSAYSCSTPRCSAGIDSARWNPLASSRVSYGFTRTQPAPRACAAPANSERTRTPFCACWHATYSYATKFIPSLSEDTTHAADV